MTQPAPRGRVARPFDRRKIGLEVDRLVLMSARRRARKDDRLRVQPLVIADVRIRPGPVVLVRRPVEVLVAREAAVDVDGERVLAGDDPLCLPDIEESPRVPGRLSTGSRWDHGHAR